jgi:hypothetical protein
MFYPENLHQNQLILRATVGSLTRNTKYQKENKSEQALQIIGHVVADSMQINDNGENL